MGKEIFSVESKDGMLSVKKSFHKKSFYYGSCSKCDTPFTTNYEIGQEVYPTKAELMEAMIDYDWKINDHIAICNECV